MSKKQVLLLTITALSVAFLAGWHAADAGGGDRIKQEELPAAVRAAIAKAFPGCKIHRVRRRPQILLLYEVELEHGGKEVGVEAFVNGEMLTVEKEIRAKELPRIVARSLERVTGGAPVRELEVVEKRATISVARYGQPRRLYRAEIARDGREMQLVFAQNGRLVERRLEEDDDEEGEREVALEDIPDAVRATILKHAGRHRVREVEVHGRGDGRFYEAEWVAGGREVEVSVAPDGTLLDKSTEEEEGEEEEDDD